MRKTVREHRDKAVASGERRSPASSMDPSVSEMYGWATAYIRDKDANNPEVLKYKKIFKAYTGNLYKQLIRKEDDPFKSYNGFLSEVTDSFWTGFSLFLRVEYRTDTEEAKGEAPRQGGLVGGKRQWIREQRKPDQIKRDYIIEKYKKMYPDTDPIQTYTIEKLTLYSDFYFKTLKKCLELKISPLDALFLSERVYGHEGYMFDTMMKPPYSLDVKTIARVWRTYPLKARESFKKWAEVGGELTKEYWGVEIPGEKHESNRKWVPSRHFIRDKIFQSPRTVVKGLKVVDEQLENLQGEFKNIPRDIIVNACIKNPEEGDGKDTEGYRKDLGDIVTRVTELTHAFKTSQTLAEDTKVISGGYIFEDFNLTKLLYKLVSRRGTALKQDDIRDSIDQAEKIIKAEKINSFTTKRRILSKLISDGPDANLKRIIIAEKRRQKEEEKILEGASGEAEKMDEVWGNYYLLFGQSNLNKKDRGYTKDFLERGKALIDLVVEQLGEERAEVFLENRVETLFKYLGNEKNKNEEIFTDAVSLGEFKEALLLAPHDTKRYYERITQIRKDNKQKELATWPDSILEIEYEEPWDEEEEV